MSANKTRLPVDESTLDKHGNPEFILLKDFLNKTAKILPRNEKKLNGFNSQLKN